MTASGAWVAFDWKSGDCTGTDPRQGDRGMPPTIGTEGIAAIYPAEFVPNESYATLMTSQPPRSLGVLRLERGLPPDAPRPARC